MKKRTNEKTEKSALPAVTTTSGSLRNASGGFPEPASTPMTQLYNELRRRVPVIDAAVLKLVRLTGNFRVDCSDKAAQKALDAFIQRVPVGGNRSGLSAFISTYFEQLLTCGTALGEIVTDTDGCPAALWNARLEGVELCRAENGFDVDILVNTPYGRQKVRRRDLCLLSVLNPAPGMVTGSSLLCGLPFISGVLLKIYESIGCEFERLGNLRFSVTYKPSDDIDRSCAAERARLIAGQWSDAMTSGGTKDFVAVGDVQIKAIGADAHIPEVGVPARLLTEQIVAKTGLPPFMLGLSWSSTERMSAQQADVLTSELEAYRRILNPVIEKICRTFLRYNGFGDGVKTVWDDITLQDEVGLSEARLNNAKAKQLEEKGGESE